MKVIKNDRASYKTRAIIGSPKPVGCLDGNAVGNRHNFVVDRNGYFVWQKAQAKSTSNGSKKK